MLGTGPLVPPKRINDKRVIKRTFFAPFRIGGNLSTIENAWPLEQMQCFDHICRSATTTFFIIFLLKKLQFHCRLRVAISVFVVCKIFRRKMSIYLRKKWKAGYYCQVICRVSSKFDRSMKRGKLLDNDTQLFIFIAILIMTQLHPGAAVAEWLSSWLAEQEDRGSIPGLATWIFRD